MAKAKSSRKGKKQWRKNISTAAHVAFLDKAGKEERSGGAVEGVSSSELFFVDTKKTGSTPLRKVDKFRTKTLHADSILKRGSMVPPVSWPAARPKKVIFRPSLRISSGRSESEKRGAEGTKGTEGSGVPSSIGVPGEHGSAEGDKGTEIRDLWGEGDTVQGLRQAEKSISTAVVVRPSKKGRAGKKRGAGANPVVPAVEVQEPGCSFNPGFEAHQESLAAAVGEEWAKEARKETEAQAPPLHVLRDRSAEAAEWQCGLEGLLFMEGEDEDKAPASEPAAHADMLGGGEGEEEGEAEEEEEEGQAVGAPSRPVRVRRLTRADLNRKIRRREQEQAQDARLKSKRLLSEAGRVEEIVAEVEEEKEVAERRRKRLAVSKSERRLEAPPRLGKHRFDPAPKEVLLSEEVTGSLREVKGCFTLVRDRFKSLQKRGLLEPRVPVRRTAAKRRRVVESGSKGRKEREMHAEILAMRVARRAEDSLIPLH